MTEYTPQNGPHFGVLQMARLIQRSRIRFGLILGESGWIWVGSRVDQLGDGLKQCTSGVRRVYRCVMCRYRVGIRAPYDIQMCKYVQIRLHTNCGWWITIHTTYIHGTHMQCIWCVDMYYVYTMTYVFQLMIWPYPGSHELT